MNRKQVGIIAEQVVVCDLLRQGYEVFTSVSDNSRVDVVPLNKKTGRIAKIQVKSTSTLTSNDSITFRIKKAGYFNYSYTEKDIDYFAFVYAPRNEVVYVKYKQLKTESTMTFRFNEIKSKNNQTKKINFWIPNKLSL
tara:strand:- start:20 stop:433 length:414 start_codon:yes stop_codon:yes gene_type:complete